MEIMGVWKKWYGPYMAIAIIVVAVYVLACYTRLPDLIVGGF